MCVRIFIHKHTYIHQEKRTAAIDDTNQPEWAESLTFKVDDVASARVVFLVFDANENDKDKFMCMTVCVCMVFLCVYFCVFSCV